MINICSPVCTLWKQKTQFAACNVETKAGVGVDKANEHSRRVNFITHSLGGLCAKEMLLLLDEDASPTSLQLLDQFSNLVFCGAPHRGSPCVSQSTFLACSCPLEPFLQGPVILYQVLLTVREHQKVTIKPSSACNRSIRFVRLCLLQRRLNGM